MENAMMEENDPLLNTQEMAKLLGVAPATLEVWRVNKRYNLPYIKIGRNVRYRRSAGLKFLDANTKAAA